MGHGRNDAAEHIALDFAVNIKDCDSNKAPLCRHIHAAIKGKASKLWDHLSTATVLSHLFELAHCLGKVALCPPHSIFTLNATSSYLGRLHLAILAMANGRRTC